MHATAVGAAVTRGAPTTQLTIRHLRAEGWPLVDKVEHWDGHRTRDLLGLFDVLALGPLGTCAVQTTTRANVASRVRKIADHPDIGHIREAGWRLLVHGWHQPGGPRTRWVLGRTIDVS